MVPNLFSIFTLIGTLSEHTLVSNHSDCEVINCNAMILSKHYFWRHVTWSSRSIFWIFGVPYSGDPQISYPQITLLIKNQILGLNVSMDNTVLVQIVKASQHARHKKFFRDNINCATYLFVPLKNVSAFKDGTSSLPPTSSQSPNIDCPDLRTHITYLLKI